MRVRRSHSQLTQADNSLDNQEVANELLEMMIIPDKKSGVLNGGKKKRGEKSRNPVLEPLQNKIIFFRMKGMKKKRNQNQKASIRRELCKRIIGGIGRAFSLC